MAEFLKRKEKGKGLANKVKEVAMADTDAIFAKKFPALAEFLSLEAWDADTERVRGTVSLFWEEGSFKASVNDRDSDQVAFVSKTTFQGLLEAIEKGLQADSLDWRGQKQKGGGRGKRS